MPKTAKRGYVLGVDVGGTKIATGLVSTDPQVITRTVIPTPNDDRVEIVMAQIYRSIDETLANSGLGKSEIVGIGIVAPGPLDPRTGILYNAPNIPAFRNVPLLGLVQHRFGIPTLVENDANAAGLAEAVFGGGVGYDYVLYVTVSTGIGTGIVIHQEIFHGKHGAAGEGGHITIDHRGRPCNCGRRGCIEAYASGRAVTQRALERLSAAGTSSKIVDLVHGDLEQITPVVVSQAAAQGDAVATAVIRETGEYLAVWLGGLVSLVDPDVIIIGGGLSAMGDLLFDHIRALLATYSINPHAHEIPIVQAHLRRDVGILGAASLHFSHR